MTVVAIAAGTYHSLALCSDGSVVAWGDNSYGQLGSNTTTDSLVPVAVNTAAGVSALAGKTVVAIAAGAYHSLALCSDGSVVAWGFNSDGELGDNSTTPRLAPVAVNTTSGVSVLSGRTVVGIQAGESHSVALCTDGTVAGWGWNGSGQLGDGTTTLRKVPVSVSTVALAAGDRFTMSASGSNASHTVALVAPAPPPGSHHHN
jgi:alpha-tubulin suppressor-like RCC1 family protein